MSHFCWQCVINLIKSEVHQEAFPFIRTKLEPPMSLQETPNWKIKQLTGGCAVG
jgi:hypothetical protein